MSCQSRSVHACTRVYTHAHTCTPQKSFTECLYQLYITLKLETVQVSINRRMDKKIGINLYNRILLSNKKEQIIDKTSESIHKEWTNLTQKNTSSMILFTWSSRIGKLFLLWERKRWLSLGSVDTEWIRKWRNFGVQGNVYMLRGFEVTCIYSLVETQ